MVMDDKEKLVELIASKVCGEYSPVCDERQPHDCGKCYANDCHISEIADHLIAHGVTVQRWIPVKDRLPEESGYYLYLANHPHIGLQKGVGVSYFQHKAKEWKKVYTPCVTHWMPLPEPPKGE